MASITTKPNGSRMIQFSDEQGRRRTIYIGKQPIKAAQRITDKIEELIAAKVAGTAWTREIAEWIKQLSPKLREKLSATGLIEAKPTMSLSQFLESILQRNLKPNSISHYRTVILQIKAHFPEDMRQITPRTAAEFMQVMRNQFAPVTANMFAKRCRQFFAHAASQELIGENPFKEIKAGTLANPERACFIDEETSQKVMNACPDTQWKLIFALCRYGGLRCPSEVNAVKWEDFNLSTGKFLINSPKTGKRYSPIWPEIRKALDEHRPNAQGEYLVTVKRFRYRFQQILRNAGIKPWTRLFHNLRSTRETELCEKWPIHKVVKWIGNSEIVASKHYLQTTDQDYLDASKVTKCAAPELQNTQQQPTATTGNTPQGTTEDVDNSELTPSDATTCDSLQTQSPHQGGIVNRCKCQQIITPTKDDVAKTAAIPIDPELARIHAAWPELQPAIKRAIMSLIS